MIIEIRVKNSFDEPKNSGEAERAVEVVLDNIADLLDNFDDLEFLNSARYFNFSEKAQNNFVERVARYTNEDI